MRKWILLLTVFVIIILQTSCEESFSPVGHFNDEYVLTCILRIDTTFQVASLTRSYEMRNTSNDNYIQGAKISLTCSNFIGTEVFYFRDTTTTSIDNLGNATTSHHYYLMNYKPTIGKLEINQGVFQKYNYLVTAKAILPDGTNLESQIWSSYLDSTYIKSYKQNNPKDLDLGFLSFSINPVSQPELLIKYSKYENGAWRDYEKLVPKYYYTNGNSEIPVYPKIELFDQYVKYDTAAIRKTLQYLSTNDPNKQNYIIRKVVFILNVFDGNLKTYFSSQQSFLNDFSYRVNQPDYTNISGGLGVFGWMYSIKKEIPLTSMIKSLGYRTN